MKHDQLLAYKLEGFARRAACALAAAFCSAAFGQVPGAAWTCDGNFYQVRAASGQPSTLFRLVNPPDNSPFTVTTLYSLSGANVSPATNTFVNGLAYNTTDNYMYALHRGAVGGTDAPNNNLYRIGQTGAQSLGVVSGLPASFAPTAADFDDRGNYYVLAGGTTSTMYRIPLATAAQRAAPAVDQVITLSASIPNVGDMSYRAGATVGTGTFYGLTTGTSGLSISLTGTVNNLTFTGLPAGAGWGTTWIDPAGFFFGYDNFATGGTTVYRINLGTNTAVADSTGVAISGSDGASCTLTPITAQVSGTVFLDGNSDGILNGTDSGLVLPATVLTVYASDGFGRVVGKATISPTNGTFTITGLRQGANYVFTLVNDSSIAIGAAVPAASLPTGVTRTGESFNTFNDGAANGQYPGLQTPATGNLAGLNFGVRGVANITISKNDSRVSTAAGDTLTYDLVIANAGPVSGNNTTVRDPAITGLNCTSIACPAASLVGGATCPSAASLTVADLQGASGIAIPILPPSGSVTLRVSCTVSATGQP